MTPVRLAGVVSRWPRGRVADARVGVNDLPFR